jgi:GxxExxY protein
MHGDHPEKLLFREVTERIIGAAFEVRKHLGFGFLEKVYQRALQAELLQSGGTAVIEHPIPVHYKGVNVGEYFADLLVDGVVVVEIKVASEYSRHDEAHLLNELKATGLRVGLLLNFGRTKLEFKRLVL